MHRLTADIPDDRYVAQVLLDATGWAASSIRRFPTGLCHYVYDVTTACGRQVVVRVAGDQTRDLLTGGVYWSKLLRPMGVPLPELLAVRLEARWPYVVLERFPGTDLGNAYPSLSRDQKQALAAQMVQLQRMAGELPLGRGYGCVSSYDATFPSSSWVQAVDRGLARAREWIERVGIVDPRHVDRVQAKAQGLVGYLEQVPPTPFLDDITTKNVIIDQGRLTGIVDVDELAFGDPLATIALTRMSLLGTGYDRDYTDAWCGLLHLTDMQRRALHLYTAGSCVTFMGELGQQFNKEQAQPVDPAAVQRLEAVLEQELASA